MKVVFTRQAVERQKKWLDPFTRDFRCLPNRFRRQRKWQDAIAIEPGCIVPGGRIEVIARGEQKLATLKNVFAKQIDRATRLAQASDDDQAGVCQGGLR